MATQPTAISDWLVVLPLLLCLAGAALLLVVRDRGRAQGWVAFALVAVVSVSDGALFERVLSLGPMSMTMGMDMAGPQGKLLRMDTQMNMASTGKALPAVKKKVEKAAPAKPASKS